MKKIYAVFIARNREFFRDRAALAWSMLLPFLIALGFAFAFSGTPRTVYKVAVLGESATAHASELAFLRTRYVQFIPIEDLGLGIQKLKHHQFDMLLDVSGQLRYWVNSSSPNGYLLERVLLAGDQPAGAAQFHRLAVDGREIRYIDWLMPGVLGMNMMFSALFGVGYVIVRYRKAGVLKRLSATPLSALEFLTAQIASRLWIVGVVSVTLYIVCRACIDFSMEGSYPTLLFLFALGATNLIALGLITAARLSSDELANGLLNLMSWPMMFLSGVWFSPEGMHPLLQLAAQCLPLTHIVAGARAIMLDGAGLADIYPHIVFLALTGAVFLAIGTMMFRWEPT